MTPYLVLSITLLQIFSLASSSPLGTPDSGNRANHYVVLDYGGLPVTVDPILKQCLNEEEALKQQAEVQMHIQRKKQLEEEAVQRMNREIKAKSTPGEGIFKKAMRNIPILKRFVRDLNREEQPKNGPVKEQLKKFFQSVWGEPHSKGSDSLGKQFSSKVSKARADAKVALESAKEGFVEGIKIAAKGAVNMLGKLVIPESIRSSWPEVKEKLGEKMKKVAVKAPILWLFIPGTPPDYWPDPAPQH